MTRAAQPDLAKVVSSAAAGDKAAFGRIVAAYHDDMVRVCMYIVRSEALAEEAVQVAWSIAWRKLDSIREPEQLRPWLVRVAVNESKKLLKKRRRRHEIEVAAVAPERAGGVDPATVVESIDLRARPSVRAAWPWRRYPNTIECR